MALCRIHTHIPLFRPFSPTTASRKHIQKALTGRLPKLTAGDYEKRILFERASFPISVRMNANSEHVGLHLLKPPGKVQLCPVVISSLKHQSTREHENIFLIKWKLGSNSLETQNGLRLRGHAPWWNFGRRVPMTTEQVLLLVVSASLCNMIFWGSVTRGAPRILLRRSVTEVLVTQVCNGKTFLDKQYQQHNVAQHNEVCKQLQCLQTVQKGSERFRV